MIVKNPEYRYRAMKVSKGITKGKSEAYTRFSISDYDKKQKLNSYVSVMVFGDLQMQHGDLVSFKDYQVGVNQYKGKQQTTLFVSEKDLTISQSSANEEVPGIAVDELPF